MAAAAAPKKKQVVRKVNYAMIHKLGASVSLLAFGIIIAAGIQAEVSVFTMSFRAAVVILLVGLVSKVSVSILAAYEEANGGEK